MSGMELKPLGPQVFAVPTDVPWTELNRRYFAFATSLPSPLDTLARDRHLFRGKGESLQIDSLAELHPLITCLPWLFDEAFPSVSQTEILDIAEAGVFLFMGMLLIDAYHDNQLSNSPDIPLLYQKLTSAARSRLNKLFDGESLFWRYLEKYEQEYHQALSFEKEHWGQVKAYPLDLMYQIGSGKVALLKTVITGLAIKGKDEKRIERVETAIDLLAAAMQLGDDIVDWPEDYQNQNYTLPLAQVIPTEYWLAASPSVEEIGQRFDNSVILETLILQVIEWFQEALDVVDEFNCPHWVAFVESCLTMTRNYQEAIVVRKLLKTFNSYPSFSVHSTPKFK
jgi:hypothetical protein